LLGDEARQIVCQSGIFSYGILPLYSYITGPGLALTVFHLVLLTTFILILFTYFPKISMISGFWATSIGVFPSRFLMYSFGLYQSKYANTSPFPY